MPSSVEHSISIIIVAPTRTTKLAAFEEELGKGARLLSRRDPVLRPIIKRHGIPSFRPHVDYFDTLVDSVVSQQISSKAAESILRKLREAMGGFFDPKTIIEAPDEVIRGAGISPQKLGYLRSLAAHVVEGRLELERLPELPDERIIAELTDIKGIGIWTAQMFLIFSLGRLDVLPTGDLGVRKGMQVAYGLDELPVPRRIEEIAEANRWAPYRSIAVWYMWRAASGE